MGRFGRNYGRNYHRIDAPSSINLRFNIRERRSTQSITPIESATALNGSFQDTDFLITGMTIQGNQLYLLRDFGGFLEPLFF